MANRRVLQSLIALALVLLAALPADAGRKKPRSAAQRASRPAPAPEPVYDPATEIALDGTVDEVKELTMLSRTDLRRIVLRTAEGPVLVQLGPSSFLKSQDFHCDHGDALTLVGSRVPSQGGSIVLARSVTKGDRTLVLRDAEGRPEWVKLLREARLAAGGN